ncbi:MAG: dihydrofolate reductase [Christensenellaceae bacterium]|nr:dihydrofolate reductase [Christensenellaceae bacterium]
MKTIVAVDEKWGIGKNNDLLFHLPEDMRYFREKTTGKIVVMGSNTLKSFPGGKPLKNRTNVVLWPDGDTRDDCIVVKSLKELFKTLSRFDANDVFIIGGAMFYKTMLPYCDTAYITKVRADGQAQVFFENLDTLDNWNLIDESDVVCDGGYELTFCTYKNSSPEKF